MFPNSRPLPATEFPPQRYPRRNNPGLRAVPPVPVDPPKVHRMAGLRPAEGVDLNTRVIGALRCLWSLSRDAEGKQIVEELAGEFINRVEKAEDEGAPESSAPAKKGLPKVLVTLGQIQRDAIRLDANPLPSLDAEVVRRIQRNAEKAIDECSR